MKPAPMIVHKTRRAADLASLFTGRGTSALLPASKYCSGKYAASIIGKPLEGYALNPKYLAFWAEKRRDADGVYYTIRCVCKPD